MNEYVLGFVDNNEVWRELTFRGVSQTVARALAKGLSDQFAHVTLTASEPVQLDLGEEGS